MEKKYDPWYIHAGLYVVIAGLVAILIKVAVIDPQAIVAQENYWKNESRLRMLNLREAMNLYSQTNGKYTNNMDSLITFLKTSKLVDSLLTKNNPVTGKPYSIFKKLSTGEVNFDSIRFSTKVHQLYMLSIDTTHTADTTINQFGKVVKIDSTKLIGTKYLIEDPSGYGSVGDLKNDALKNTASWE
ncbi:MAG: hypothetical protein IAE91_11080 [Ignavibacteriaceae bacterium]|nr:hypothetical protein [Ignavibacteriaceae bacterium]